MVRALATLALLLAGGAASPELPAGERERLDRGEILFSQLDGRQASGIAVRAQAVVEASPDAVWRVLRECGEYDEFLPSTRFSELRHREANVAICYTVIDMPFPLDDLVSETRVVERSLPDGGFERRWSLLRGSYSRNDGAWSVQPWQGAPDRALVDYHVDFELDTLVPQFLLRSAQRRTLPAVFEALRQRVRERAASQRP